MLQDSVIGLSDDLTVPFALAAAVQSSGLVITAGLAEIVAGSIAMGLGGYLAGRPKVEHYAAELVRKHQQVRTMPDVERREMRELLGEMGLSPATQELARARVDRRPRAVGAVYDKVRVGTGKVRYPAGPQSALTTPGPTPWAV